MSNGLDQPSSGRHLPQKHQYSSEVKSNLYKLGLLGNKTRKKPTREPKGVEFRTLGVHDSIAPAAPSFVVVPRFDLAHMLSYPGFQPRSRYSQFSTNTAKPPASHSSGSSSAHSPSVPRSSRGMAGVLDLERSRTRRERTFIGSECAVCEEPLEHTLRGERILQLSCGHVSHEACFYEYIREFESQNCPTCNAPLGLDPSRGNVLDLGK
jgi:Ring finger domain